ncbi:DUF805 domain-containing protein [Rhizobium rhizogenes]|uniref:SHOCT domain-containing protein n=1 Tax=Rhizobium rhizogenes TaxID=359 RepID=A0AA92H950_RHIRH|nr:DUF805 domain-containing protein [Rhizobium rhizogenes]PVE54015.1 hypothetical protein DC430_12240 [Rhizobium rhizogenes]PVE66506.1 hypothetical protein DC415_08855 [Agrobacterium tumefaciens]PVE76494.1 hypothetical protein DCP16_08855 [Sphingomonas sp. TPD3009]
MTAYIEAMRRYGTFSGQSTRGEFWYFHLVVLALAFVGLIIDVIIAGPNEPQPLVSAVIVIGHYLPSLAIIVRRLHDFDKSGWLALTCLIPVIGIIAFIVIGSWPSKPLAQEAAGLAARGDQPARQSNSIGSAEQIERIEKLAALSASGAITDDEFAAMKAHILQNLQPAQKPA